MAETYFGEHGWRNNGDVLLDKTSSISTVSTLCTIRKAHIHLATLVLRRERVCRAVYAACNLIAMMTTGLSLNVVEGRVVCTYLDIIIPGSVCCCCNETRREWMGAGFYSYVVSHTKNPWMSKSTRMTRASHAKRDRRAFRT